LCTIALTQGSCRSKQSCWVPNKMGDKNKTKEQLTRELTELRQRIVELERAEIERKRETLRGSEEELREIIDSVKDGVVLLDVTGKVTTINKRVTEVAGYAAEDVVGKRLTLLKKMFPPKSLATMFAAFTQVISGRQPPPYEVEVYAQTGEKLFVEIHGSLLMKGGEKAGVVAVLRDITERKRLEALLLRERETFVTILQHALYGVVLLDRDGKHVYVNPAFTAITGYTLEDIPTERDWTHKAYPDEAYRQQVTTLWKKDRRLGVTRRVISVVCRNGETKEIEFRPTVLDDGRAVVMLADITEHKRAEEKLQRHREDLEKLVTERTAALQAANDQLQREIAERKGIEEELQRAYGELKESEERFRTIFETAQDFIALKDRDCKFTYVNPAMERHFGIPASKLIGRTSTALFGKERSARIIEEDLRVLSGEIINEEHPSPVEGSSTIHNIIKVPIRNSAGEIIGLCNIGRDITERKRMEEELRENEERFKMLVEHAPSGISIMAPDRSFEYINPRFTKIFGYTMQDIPDKDTWFEKAYPDKAYRNKVIATWERDIAEKVKIGEENPRVFTVRCKNGQDKIIDFRRVDLKDGKQYQIYEDITLRATAEEALRESEERYRTLVDNIDLGITRIDSDYTISMVNATLSRGVQKATSELIGKKCFREFEHRDAVCPHCPGVQAMATGEPTAVEVEVVRDDGYRSHVRLQAFPVFGHDGTVTGFIEVAEQITERKRMEEELRERQKELQALMDASPIAISWADLQGNIQYINRKHHELFGYTLEEIPTIAEWQRRADQDQVQREEFNLWLDEIMEAHKYGKSLPPREMTVTCKDGFIRSVTVEGTVVSNRTLVIYNDITGRKQMEENLRESEERFRLLVEHSKDAIVLHDFDGKIIDVNQHACDSLGYTREELLGLSVQDIDQNVIAGKHKEKWNQMILGEPITLEGIHRRKDGMTFPVEIRLGVLESGGRRLMLGLVRDVTERVRVEETIRKLAYHDALTGLPNRVLFVDRLNRAMAQVHRKKRKLAVMLLDLDHFKDINDTLGHSVGDQLLNSVGKRLTGLLRKEDTVSRMGGDEFFLLLSEVDRVQDAATIAQKVLKAFQEPFVLDVHEINITTSIGVAMYPDEGADVKTLLKNADVALYQAKQEGRNNYQHYTVAMDPGFQGDG
jgi:diguanylate cyclase (GGDEF)-like protein/PAS domain S-box-containing protein